MAEATKTSSRIPKNLLNALAEGRCILFVGAGASMDAVDEKNQQLPHWGQLLSELLQVLEDTSGSQPPEVISELNGMLSQGDFMSVADWIDKELGPHSFHKHLMDRLLTANSSRVHEILSQKPFRAVMTTNYDDLINIHWQKQGKRIIDVIPQNPQNIAIATAALDRPSSLTPIIRAHGAVTDAKSLIFFPRSYRQIMFRNQDFRQFMSKVFRQFTVLFVGTSFRDPNFQSILQWIYTETEGNELPHYAILDNKGPVFQNYLKNNYNIELISYQSAGGDHSALIDILNSL